MAEAQNSLFQRFAVAQVRTALADTPVVMINGPRQCGKTTLVRSFIDKDRAYFTLDDDTVAAAAQQDPAGFLRGPARMIIDEVQRAPALLRAIKMAVDADRRPGRFLLTGSANVLTLPQVSESLAGRMEVIELLPLSRAEIAGRKPTFCESLFAGRLPPSRPAVQDSALVAHVLAGGYPEMLRRDDPRRRQVWAREYVRALVQRDVRDIGGVEKYDQLSRLLRVLAEHSGQLVNFAQAGGQVGLDGKTTGKYLAVLEQIFVLRRIEPWFRNTLKRLVKTPKVHFLDSGLLAALQGVTAVKLTQDRSRFGALLESFVFGEVLKQSAWSDGQFQTFHYRDKDQNEVDFVLEREDSALAGVEVKAAATVGPADFKGLSKLAEAGGKAFRMGVVLYDGDKLLPFGDRMFAAPISALWH